MTVTTPIDTGRVESLLTEAFGRPVTITATTRIEPWFVVRCRLAEGAGDIPESVIVKALRSHPEGFRTDPAQVLTECCALGFVEELGLAVAPRIYASDVDAGVLVLEDLEPRESLWRLLATKDEAADVGLRTFARVKGELHAATGAYEGAYYEKREALGAVDRHADRMAVMGRWHETKQMLEAFGAGLSAPAEAEIDRVIGALADPGPLLALSNGDAGANNFLVSGDDGRLIDFEFAGYRHVLADAQCLYVPGSMWMTVGDPRSDGTEDIYRTAAASGIPEVADDEVFGFGLAAACVGHAVERLNRVVKVDQRPPGHESRVQMISTIEAAARAADAHEQLPALVDWLTDLSLALRRRWPDADVDIASLGPYALREPL